MKIRRDGKAYDGADCIVTALGNILDDVQEITYTTTQEHQLNYSLGSCKATSWSMGKISHEASITILMAGVSVLEKAAGGSLMGIKPFEINITLANEYNEIVNDTLLVRFMSQGRTVNTEMGLAQQYSLFVLDADYNNVL